MWNWIKKYWDKVLMVLLVMYLIDVEMWRHQFRYLSFSPSEATLDFTNSSGVTKVGNNGFPEIVIGSEGATKTGEGYRVKLKTINPSSIKMSGQKIVFTWTHRGQERTSSIDNPNISIPPGGHVDTTTFLSPLEGDELKYVLVKENFEFVASY
jgi:hypothetical protein